MNEEETTISEEETRIQEEVEKQEELVRLATLQGIEELVKIEKSFHELVAFIVNPASNIYLKYMPYTTALKLNADIKKVLLDCTEKYTEERESSWKY